MLPRPPSQLSIQQSPTSFADATFVLPPHTSWSSHYLRSNRNGGKKHLRCFPVHLDSEHNNTRGCHIPLRVRAVGLRNPERTLVIARFHCAGEAEAEAELGLRLGSLQRRSDVEGLLRSRRQPLNPLMAAKWAKPARRKGSDVSGPTVVEQEVHAGIFSYDFAPEAWHYGWKSNRHAKDTRHRLSAYVLTPDAGATCADGGLLLRCVAVVSSPMLTVYSRRGGGTKRPFAEHEESAVSEAREHMVPCRPAWVSSCADPTSSAAGPDEAKLQQARSTLFEMQYGGQMSPHATLYSSLVGQAGLTSASIRAAAPAAAPRRIAPAPIGGARLQPHGFLPVGQTGQSNSAKTRVGCSARSS